MGSMHPSLTRLEHRPWPLPPGRWTWRQSWYDLLFAHWPVPAAELRRYAESCVVLSRFSLRSAPGWDRGPGLRIGAIGQATYRAVTHDRYWHAALSLLAAFARYAGVGTLTTSRRSMRGRTPARTLPARPDQSSRSWAFRISRARSRASAAVGIPAAARRS